MAGCQSDSRVHQLLTAYKSWSGKKPAHDVSFQPELNSESEHFEIAIIVFR
jgi:hypothetical protein